MKFLMVMGYTSDYTVGKVCEYVNHKYAKQHNYSFVSKVLSCEETTQLLLPKLGFTWFKIHLLREILIKLLTEGQYDDFSDVDYLFWIDSDAIFLDNATPLEYFIEKSQEKNLIIVEDVHTCCLINSGVFFLRVNQWSLDLLNEVWAVTKYDKVYFYEQSALLKVLKKRREGLEKKAPFHSYAEGGNMNIKIYRNFVVWPHNLFSSNYVMLKPEFLKYEKAMKEQRRLLQPSQTDKEEPEQELENEDDDCDLCSPGVLADGQGLPKLFIYHAAGVKRKLDYIRAVLDKYQISIPSDELSMEDLSFELYRNNLGHYVKEEDWFKRMGKGSNKT
jgi:hypothetical protein